MSEQVFVARERPLRQLQAFLDRALAGQSQVCFVAGEAGAGKSALVREFARQAEEAHEDLVTVLGECNAQTGTTDPYLPFRDVLAMLTGDVLGEQAERALDARNAARLKKLLHVSWDVVQYAGPNLLALFVPGGAVLGVVGIVASVAANHSGVMGKLDKRIEGDRGHPAELDQAQIFQQYTAVLKGLAEKQPLIVILDDLHWADAASVSLLFHLARQLNGSRVLLLGTYRPEDVALGRGAERHPLEPVLNELKRYYGDIVLDLEQQSRTEGWDLVNDLIDAEPNRLGQGFRQSLFAKTDGQPLFTVELIRNLQERGDLVRDDEGCWVERPGLDWDALPARVEGVIEERIGRLAEDLRETLTIGCVEGEAFEAQVVGRVRQASERQLLKDLSRELERRHRLVHEQGELKVGRNALSRYRFSHTLFQKYLYDDLSTGERRLLHGEVAEALEALYEGHTDDIVVQLARHYDKSGDDDKAVEYLIRAGERARRISAYAEAIASFERGLALLPSSKDGGPGDRTRATLLVRLGECHKHQGNYRVAAEHLRAGLALGRAVGDTHQATEALVGLSELSAREGEYDKAQALGDEALALARTSNDRGLLAKALRRLAGVLIRQGNYPLAEQRLQEALPLLQELGDGRGVGACLSHLGTVAIAQGDYTTGARFLEQALAVARDGGNRLNASQNLNNLGAIAYFQGDYPAAVRYYTEALTIAQEIGAREDVARSRMNLGEATAEQGDTVAARRYYQQALQDMMSLGSLSLALDVLTFVARPWVKAGEHLRAAELLGLALSHPASNAEVKQNAEPALALLRAALPAEQLETALAQGKQMNLEQVVQGIMAA